MSRNNILAGGIVAFFGLASLGVGALSKNLQSDLSSGLIALGILITVLGITVIVLPFLEG